MAVVSMEKFKCRVCGAEFPRKDIMAIEGIDVCPECKPIFEQKLRQATGVRGDVRPDDAVDKQYSSLKRTWFIMLLWPVFLLCLVLLRLTNGRLVDESAVAMMRIALYAFAGICLLASVYVRKLMVSRLAGQASSGRLPPRSSTSKQTSPSEKYQRAVVVSLVICEFIAIAGIYLFVRSKSAPDLYLLLLVAVVAMVMNRPKKEELVGLTEASLASLSPDASCDLQGWEMPPELEMPKPRIVRFPRQRWAWYLLIVFFLSQIFLVGFRMHLYDQLVRLYIVSNGIAGVGTVENAEHITGHRYSDNLLRFTYRVPTGQIYRAQAHVDAELLRLGKGVLVQIHYLPTRPDLAALDDDGGRLKWDAIGVSCILLAVLFVMGILTRSQKKTRRILSIGDAVSGVVERAGKVRFGLRPGCYRLSVRFRYNDREWQSKTTTYDPKVTFDTGDVITLLVDPADPKSVVAYAGCGYEVVGSARGGLVEAGRSTKRTRLLVIAFSLVLLLVCFASHAKLVTFLLPQNSPIGAFPVIDSPPKSEITSNRLLLGQSAKVHGKYSIAANPMEELDFKTKQEIYDLRKARVLQHPDLAPEHYAPSEAVFGQVMDKRPWWGIYGIYFYGNGQNSVKGPSEQSIFLLNPYLLIGLREPNAYRKPDLAPPGEGRIFYPQPLRVEWEAENRRALITYNLHDHYQHVTTHRYRPTSGYLLDLIAYNARDLGLPYLYVDAGKSENVVPLQRAEKAFPINQYIHCGASCGYPGGCNNISPASPPELIIDIRKLPARVQVKLWRNEPKRVNDQSDMTVTIKMM
jgi:hypothetical protein